MAKFVIECPKCGSYIEGKTGFFAKKKLACACGNVVNVKTDKMASKVCTRCGNTVVYDQSEGDKALCPVCHEPINKREEKKVFIDVTCPSCSCVITLDKRETDCICPLCDMEIDVQKRIQQETIKSKGQTSVIKYEGTNDVFVWKHPIEDFNLGSQLIVNESQEALFFRDGKALDLFGAGRYTLATQKLPVLENLYKLPTESTVFHSEVYFINMTTQMGVKWGTDSKVRLFDPGSGLHIEVGACGTFNIRVSNSRKLIVKLVGTESEFSQADIIGAGIFGIEVIVGKFRSLIINRVKANLARAIRENNINILIIDEYLDILSERLRGIINETLEEYGLTMPEFFITSFVTPDDDPNFRRLKQQFADKTLLVRQEEIRKAEAEAAQDRKIVEAQTEAKLKMVGAQGEAEALRIKAQAEADAYKAKAFAEAEEMRAKGYTYQQETARKVGMEAMKNGISGNGGSMLGDVAGIGVTLSAMGSVIGMTKDALNPTLTDMKDFSASAVGTTEIKKDTWTCPECGTKDITSKFCPECGAKKPEAPATWTCPECGTKDITSKFCPECGTKKPEAPAIWTCPECGTKDITSKFCPECGAKKP